MVRELLIQLRDEGRSSDAVRGRVERDLDSKTRVSKSEVVVVPKCRHELGVDRDSPSGWGSGSLGCIVPVAGREVGPRSLVAREAMLR